VSRSLGLVGLVGLAVLALIAVIGVTRPVSVEPPLSGSTPQPTVTASAPDDGGSLDLLLDGIHVEHGINHGR